MKLNKSIRQVLNITKRLVPDIFHWMREQKEDEFHMTRMIYDIYTEEIDRFLQIARYKVQMLHLSSAVLFEMRRPYSDRLVEMEEQKMDLVRYIDRMEHQLYEDMSLKYYKRTERILLDDIRLCCFYLHFSKWYTKHHREALELIREEFEKLDHQQMELVLEMMG